MLPSTQRFSDRVENYVKYRPSYPPQVVETLEMECGLVAQSVLADVGSGTGILTSLLLEHGNRVYGVEPNLEMRLAAEALLKGTTGFVSVDGTAEATTLTENSVDFVVAGQAFHWFEPAATRREFERILRRGGWVALVWNRRPMDSTPFHDSYEKMLRLHAPEYDQVSHDRVDDNALGEFFAPCSYEARHFPSFQEFDLESLRGRVLSSSYAPLPGQPGHDEIMAGLGALFRRYNENGRIRFEYDTQLIFGHID